MRRLTSLLFPALLLLSGCETSDRVLTGAERMLGSRTEETVLRDLRDLQQDFKTIMTALTGQVQQTWGKKEVNVPEQKVRYIYAALYKPSHCRFR